MLETLEAFPDDFDFSHEDNETDITRMLGRLYPSVQVLPRSNIWK